MITAKDLAKKLTAYAKENPDTLVFLEYDGGVAFPFGGGDNNEAFGPGGLSGEGVMHKFLVLKPDLSGDRLVLKGSA